MNEYTELQNQVLAWLQFAAYIGIAIVGGLATLISTLVTMKSDMRSVRDKFDDYVKNSDKRLDSVESRISKLESVIFLPTPKT